MNVGGLFDGCGLLAYGLCLAGLEHRWLCEVDPFRRAILGRRWPGVPVYDDVRAVGAATAERVDVIAGGFPCKGASTAGKRNGFDHPETRLWREMARAVGELRPRYVVVENVANILGLHDGAVWGEVLGDLAALGYDVQWDCIPAAAFGAPHLRDRVIAVAAHADCAEERRLTGVGGQSPGWPHLGRGDLPAVADAKGEHRPSWATEAGSLGRASGRGDEPPPADTSRQRRSALPADAEQRRSRTRTGTGGRGVGVGWGQYERAVGRWASIVGPPPEPLVRRVDDRRARRVERSRLSALGDGVQVQLGHMVGSYLMSLEAAR